MTSFFNSVFYFRGPNWASILVSVLPLRVVWLAFLPAPTWKIAGLVLVVFLVARSIYKLVDLELVI
jgi:hypothetical protein